MQTIGYFVPYSYNTIVTSCDNQVLLRGMVFTRVHKRRVREYFDGAGWESLGIPAPKKKNTKNKKEKKYK